MQQDDRQKWHEKILRILFWLSWLVFLPPLLLYGQASLSGALPSEAQWYLRGGNHGPWWSEWQESFLYLSFFVMLLFEFITFGFALHMDGKWHNRRPAQRAKAMFLWACQFLAGVVIFFIVFWTID